MDQKDDLTEAIVHTLTYFAYFSYAPSHDELFIYLSIKTTKKKLTESLKELSDRKIIYTGSLSYTLPPYGIFTKEKPVRHQYSKDKLTKLTWFLKLAKYIPWILLVGVSGSISMMHAEKNDDIDLFVISSKNRLWLARCACLLLASLLRMRRKRLSRKIKDCICLNLFFDETELTVPFEKRNEYIVHEILQMKPLLSKDHAYERFLWANRWIKDLFPNVSIPLVKVSHKDNRGRGFFDLIEVIVATIQQYLVRRHRTSERIEKRQLWFFPRDVENRLKKSVPITQWKPSKDSDQKT